MRRNAVSDLPRIPFAKLDWDDGCNRYMSNEAACLILLIYEQCDPIKHYTSDVICVSFPTSTLWALRIQKNQNDV